MELCGSSKPSGVVIVADGDAPGQRGAESLAAVLLAYSAAVRIITPPAGVERCAGVEATRGDGCRRASGNRRGPGSEAAGFDSQKGRCIMEGKVTTD